MRLAEWLVELKPRVYLSVSWNGFKMAGRMTLNSLVESLETKGTTELVTINLISLAESPKNAD